MSSPVILSPSARHVARRFSAGISPTLTAEIRAAKGARTWFVRQLTPSRVTDTYGGKVNGWFTFRSRTPAQIFQRQQDGVEGSWEVMRDLSRWTVARRVHSSRQVQETMVDFWSNLLHVPLDDDRATFWRVDYDTMIRRYALDSFENLLLHATTHPAMGLHLNNAESSKTAPNENLGRELLELHSVGVDAGYTEDDVKNSARILTGYRVDVWWPTFRAFYDTTWHDTKPIKVMGFSHPNSSADGRAATTAYLRYLARHPATAQRIARRLCTKFVSDTPSDAIVAAVAAAYTRNATAIKPTLMALIDHPDFAASAGQKVRMPTEDWVATVRALGIGIRQPKSDDSFVNAMYWSYQELGQAPYEWPAPNGYPEVNAAWSSAGRVLLSFDRHRTLTYGWWPTKEAVFHSPAYFLPTLPATLQAVVDHAGMVVLGEKPTADVSQGIATLLGKSLTSTVTSGQATPWFVFPIVTSLLDSPTHLHR